MKNDFKTCTICKSKWLNLIDLVRDKDLYLNGYQASFSESHEGLFLLTHDVDDCGTTMAIKAGDLIDLYDGPKHTIHMAYTEKCDGHCLDSTDMEPCTNECDMRWAREILQILKNHGPEKLLEKIK